MQPLPLQGRNLKAYTVVAGRRARLQESAYRNAQENHQNELAGGEVPAVLESAEEVRQPASLSAARAKPDELLDAR